MTFGLWAWRNESLLGLPEGIEIISGIVYANEKYVTTSGQANGAVSTGNYL